MCAARQGRSFELDKDGEVVWEYLTPMRNGLPYPQGSPLNLADNFTFQLERYPLDYPAFIGRDLSPQGYIETNPNEDFCLSVATDEAVFWEIELKVSPNPATSFLQLEADLDHLPLPLFIYDSRGGLVKNISLNQVFTNIDIGDWTKGMYFLYSPGFSGVQVVVVQ
jgi:hypothetical protein